MTHELHFPPCILDPPHALHPPPYHKPLRVNVFGPLSAIEKLLPELTWKLYPPTREYLQQCALLLAKLVYRTVYGSEPQTQDDLVLRDETIGYINPDRPKDDVIYRGKAEGLDTYAVTFDHLVPSDNQNPEIIQIIIFETEYDDAAFANNLCRVQVDPKDYAPYRNRVLATYRCCDKLKGAKDRSRINFGVKLRETSIEEMDAVFDAEHGLISKEVSN